MQRDDTHDKELRRILEVIDQPDEVLGEALQRACLTVPWTRGGNPRNSFNRKEFVLQLLFELPRYKGNAWQHCRDKSLELFGQAAQGEDVRQHMRFIIERTLNSDASNQRLFVDEGKSNEVADQIPLASKSKTTIRCPHCGVTVVANYAEMPFLVNVTCSNSQGPDRIELRGEIFSDKECLWAVQYERCSSCQLAIIYLVSHRQGTFTGRQEIMAWPRQTTRGSLPAGVPLKIAEDYSEACAVLPVSKKASAALSRRCLQHFLHEHLHLKSSSLDAEIQALLDKKELPAPLAAQIDGIRQIGNFAAHPIKAKQSGEILDVEPGEADWSLETLQALFQFYFIEKPVADARIAALNQKLADAGKKHLKQ